VKYQILFKDKGCHSKRPFGKKRTIKFYSKSKEAIAKDFGGGGGRFKRK